MILRRGRCWHLLDLAYDYDSIDSHNTTNDTSSLSSIWDISGMVGGGGGGEVVGREPSHHPPHTRHTAREAIQTDATIGAEGWYESWYEVAA